MATQKIEKLILGTGNIASNTTSASFTASASTPSPMTGQDGDVHVKVAGINSDIYIRVNSQWISLLGAPLSTTLTNNSSGTAISFPAAAFRFMTIEYSIVRGSNMRSGTLKVLNDGTIGPTGANMSDYAVTDLGAGDVGVSFGAQVDGGGSNVELTYVSDNQPGPSIDMKYTLKGWTA